LLDLKDLPGRMDKMELKDLLDPQARQDKQD
jgi:hypothetical protein